MDKTPNDIRTQIDWLRNDTTAVLDELESRMQFALDAPGQIRRHPVELAAAGSALIAVVFGLMGYAIYSRTAGRHRGETKLEHFLEPVGEVVQEYGERVREALPGEAKKRRRHPKQTRSIGEQVFYWAVTAGASLFASFFADRYSKRLWARFIE